MSFLQIDGAGSPESDAYARAVEALYALSYPVKFASKNLLGRDYVVCPLEGLWWSDRLGSFAERAKANGSWTMMIRQPDWVTARPGRLRPGEGDREGAGGRRGPAGRVSPRVSACRSCTSAASRTRPRRSRGCTTSTCPAHGLVETGHHHEIYFSDPRTSAPEKLRTIIRQPVARR